MTDQIAGREYTGQPQAKTHHVSTAFRPILLLHFPTPAICSVTYSCVSPSPPVSLSLKHSLCEPCVIL